jgi:hypothetical protein
MEETIVEIDLERLFVVNYKSMTSALIGYNSPFGRKKRQKIDPEFNPSVLSQFGSDGSLCETTIRNEPSS